jgi:hypothetical protein
MAEDLDCMGYLRPHTPPPTSSTIAPAVSSNAHAIAKRRIHLTQQESQMIGVRPDDEDWDHDILL